jgi:hypothetical protein
MLHIIKLILCVYILLSGLNIINKPKFYLVNNFQKTITLSMIILLGFIDPIIGILTLIAIIVNYNNPENFTFSNISKKEIDDIISKEYDEPEKVPIVTIKNKDNCSLEDDFLKEYGTNNNSLNMIQNNIIHENTHLFPTLDKDVNIQGVFQQIKGYEQPQLKI